MMTLIFGTFGALMVRAGVFTEVGFFFLAGAFDGVVRLAANFLDVAALPVLRDDLLVVGLAVAFVGAATTALGAAGTGVGVGGAIEGPTGVAAGAGVGATVPAETDVVVLVACCVPFVFPNRPVMKGFAMQS
jgi:hypothetical protein